MDKNAESNQKEARHRLFQINLEAGPSRHVSHECLGHTEGANRTAGKCVLQYSNAGSKTDRRYLIAPEEMYRLEKDARAGGLKILGFYHSHPDHPAVPSEYDREHGFPFFHYVVVTVAAGLPGEIASFTLSEDHGAFEREEIRLEGAGE